MSHQADCRDPVARFVVLTVIASAFGPYLVGGIRTDQVVIYGFLVLVLMTWKLVTATPLAWRVFATWSVYALVAIVGAVAPVELPSIFPRGSVLAGIDNVVGPLAVMLLVWAVVRRCAAADLLVMAARFIAFAMAANGVIAVAMTRVDLAPYLRRFWGGAGGNDPVAIASATMGRMSGIFNQPADAGFAYGIAGLAACYVWRERPKPLFLLLIPIILGGFLSVSKVFVLGGIPLILWHVWRSKAGHGRVGLLGGGVVAFLGIAQSGYATQWVGREHLASLLSPSGNNGLSFYTAGRMGGQASLTSVLHEVARLDPWFGLGAGGLQVPSDNGWAGAFVVAGLVGLLCYTLTLFWIWRMARTLHHLAERRLMLGLLVLAIGASMGIPALTANRASTIFWVLIALSSSAQLLRDRPAGSAESLAAPDENVAGHPCRSGAVSRP